MATRSFMQPIAITLLLAIAATSVEACKREGPAERVGKEIDNATDKVRDAVDPPRGPLEKAGRKIDRAVDND